MELTLYTHPSLERLTYGGCDIWDGEHFSVTDGNAGRYLIVHGRDLLKGIDVHAGKQELAQFKNCETDEERAEFLWSVFAQAGAANHLPQILQSLYERGKRDGRRDPQCEFHRLLNNA